MSSILNFETERLFLRPVNIEDAQDVFQYRSNKEVNQYQGFIPKTMEEVESFISEKVASEINVSGTWFQFTILKKSSQSIIGDVGIHFLEGDNFQVEFGCTLDVNEQGSGYAVEAITETFNYLFNSLNKHRIIASIDPRNIASMRLIERLGMRKEAHFVKSYFLNGDWTDDVVYAILQEEWKKNH